MLKQKIKTFRHLFLIEALIAFCLVSTVGGAFAGSVELPVRASFERALVVTAGDPIVFGHILVNGNAGSVSIDKDTSNVTWSGGVVSVDQTNSERGFISFIGPRPGNVGITYDSSVPMLNAEGATVNFTPAPEVSSHNISRYNEEVVIKVGGTISFSPNTMEGSYAGSVTISVDYT